MYVCMYVYIFKYEVDKQLHQIYYFKFHVIQSSGKYKLLLCYINML